MMAAADNVGTVTDAAVDAPGTQVAQADGDFVSQTPSAEEQRKREAAAAQAAADAVAKLPDANNVFYRGFIYRDADYHYYYTDPVPTPYRPDLQFPSDTGVPTGTNTATAVYFSHPNNLFTGGNIIAGDPVGDGQNITGPEQVFGQTRGLNVYVRTSVGNVRYWEHRPRQ